MSDTEDSKPKPTNSILINLKNQDNEEAGFKIKPTTKFSKVMNAYATTKGMRLDTFRFFFDGHRIQNEDTPQTLDMSDGDMVDVFLEQLGGGC